MPIEVAAAAGTGAGFGSLRGGRGNWAGAGGVLAAAVEVTGAGEGGGVSGFGACPVPDPVPTGLAVPPGAGLIRNGVEEAGGTLAGEGVTGGGEAGFAKREVVIMGPRAGTAGSGLAGPAFAKPAWPAGRASAGKLDGFAVPLPDKSSFIVWIKMLSPP
ncbi:MAG: hypothetical protein AAB538_01940 [Patescibacteria group bacterium]